MKDSEGSRHTSSAREPHPAARAGLLKNGQPGFIVGSWTAEPDLCRISNNEQEIVLQARWMDVLVYLAENAGKVVSTDDIIENVWGNLDTSHDSVYVTLSHLRKELGRDKSTEPYIQTIAGRGYRLLAPVKFPEPNVTRMRYKALLAASAVSVIALAAIAVGLLDRETAPVRMPNSIAILPFDDLRPAGDEEYAIGFVDNLTVELDRIEGLEIIGRGSAFSVDARNATAHEIGDQLGVATILEGSLQRNGDKIEVMAQLTRTDTGLHLWTDIYRMDISAVNRLNVEIARQVAEALELFLPPEYFSTLDPNQVPILVQTRVNSYTSDNQEMARVIRLVDGGYVIAWRSKDQDGFNWGIYAQKFDANARPVGTEKRLNDYTFEGQWHSALLPHPDGGFVAGWDSWNVDGSHTGVVLRRFDATLTPLTDEIIVNQVKEDAQGNPAMVFGPDRSLLVVYDSKAADGSQYGILARLLDSDGRPLGDEFRVNEHAPDMQAVPRMAALHPSGSIAVWSSYAQDGSGWGIYGRRFDGDGRLAGPEFRVNTFTDGDQRHADIDTLDGGGAIVVWESHGQDADGNAGKGVYGQVFGPGGEPVGPEIQLPSVIFGDQQAPRVAATSDGGFFATWMSEIEGGLGLDIFGRRFDADGNPLGEQVFVNVVSNSYQRRPAPEQLADGSVIVAFHSDDWDGSYFGIFQRRLVFSGITGDPMTGSETGDTFVFESTFDETRIVDFNQEIDRIDISALDIGFSELAFEQTEDGISVGTPYGTIFVQSVTSLSEYHFLM